MKFISIPEKTVEFADGHKVTVAPFQISEHPVSVGEFRAFEQATGYKTLSERLGGKLYTFNILIEDLSEAERNQAPATCVCYEDALEFCKWARVRLPTEPEWMAAALIDEGLYDRRHPETWPFQTADGTFDPEAIRGYPVASSFREFTSTTHENGRVLLRSGPWYHRFTDWRTSENGSRVLSLPDNFSLMYCIRVAALKNGSSPQIADKYWESLGALESHLRVSRTRGVEWR